MNVYVFKTSVEENTLEHVNQLLDGVLSGSSWSFDLEDRDKILRIVCDELDTTLLTTCFNNEGFFIEELE
ncbi:hypothetical protein [Phaeocystidibacter luteus]|uniref:Uncharacterized protein n=1 Tax=Phaeocystidibacter luteus TaxID=911197 RepID=A0A6N6RJR0_9FLAO|nr:hypothetical protein [Phaeocystidibacter luteus]KAB2814003.1 hypothetical protein F8C67_04800 [Phaeocystidibacter luteus]